MRPFKAVGLKAVGLKAVGLGTAVALAVLLGGGPATAAAADHHGEAVFTLVSQATGETVVDLDGNGFSPGDYVVFTDDLFRDGVRVGSDAGSCTLIDVADGGTSLCVVTVHLERGDLTAQALTRGILAGGPDSFVAAITGGTGAFVDAGGEVIGTRVGLSSAELEFHVSR
ncbi:hypothetical protein [Kitasatospora sp. NPDC093806]|uniref:allene oxide cyclase barrel-like domain-containing protein n=1 Tax=Kitasatospora sp. NPDC093806 TaxID=3155075 RepID=UPI00344699C9